MTIPDQPADNAASNGAAQQKASCPPSTAKTDTEGTTPKTAPTTADAAALGGQPGAQGIAQDTVQIVPPSEQAALLSDKADTNVTLDGGTTPIPPPKTPPKRRKRKSNKLGCRGDEETLDCVDAYMELTKVSESEAIRQLILRGSGVPSVIIRAKAPPDQFEVFLGDIRSWRRDFRAVVSRLNAPMPANSDDKELKAIVKMWRETSNRLHGEISALLEAAYGALLLLTSLTPTRVNTLRLHYTTVQGWKVSRVGKIADAKNPADRASHQSKLDAFDAVLGLIEDLGILPDKGN